MADQKRLFLLDAYALIFRGYYALIKNPRIKIKAITTINCVQKPPGKDSKNSRTNSSPPKALNPAVSIAAPIKMIKTRVVVMVVSDETSLRVLSILNALQKLQIIEIIKATTAIDAMKTPI